MVEFNERTEFFIKDTMDDCIAEIQLMCKHYQSEQDLIEKRDHGSYGLCFCERCVRI